MTEAEGSPDVRRTPDRAILGVVFLLLFVLSYSEEIATGLFDVIGQGETEEWRIALIVLDVAILVWVGLLKRSISRDDHGPPRLWRWWWAACVAIIVLDIILNGLHEYPPAWIDVVSSIMFAVAMGILMQSSINADPATLFNSRKRAALRRDWLRVRAVVPWWSGSWPLTSAQPCSSTSSTSTRFGSFLPRSPPRLRSCRCPTGWACWAACVKTP